MEQDISQFGFHEFVRVSCSITVSINASPWRTNEDGVSCKRLNFQKVTVNELEPVEAFLIDFHVVREHLQLIGIQIVDNILFEMITKVDGNTTDS